MPSAKKISLKEKYDALLGENPEFIFTRFSGLDVGKMSELRKSIYEKGGEYQVIKNNIFKIALQERKDLEGIPEKETLAGPYGVALIKSDMPGIAKILKNFADENEPFDVVSGVMESKHYDADGIRGIAILPSKEESLSKLALQLNSPATQTAGLINQIMSSLARAIKAVGEKNG